MATVKIIKVPRGDAPLEMREKWIGAVISGAEPILATDCRYDELPSVAKEKGGFLVPFLQALKALEVKSPEAARWYLEHYPFLSPKPPSASCPFHEAALAGLELMGINASIPEGIILIFVSDEVEVISPSEMSEEPIESKGT